MFYDCQEIRRYRLKGSLKVFSMTRANGDINGMVTEICFPMPITGKTSQAKILGMVLVVGAMMLFVRVCIALIEFPRTPLLRNEFF